MLSRVVVLNAGSSRSTFSRALAVTPMARQGIIKKPVAIVKGDPKTNTLGDCPFCHRVLLTLETKSVLYDRLLIDLDNKPDWLVERAQGKVPVLKEDETYLADSDAIVDLLEERYPEPSMKSTVPSEITGKFMGAFKNTLMAEGPDEYADKAKVLHGELQKINDYLSDKGPLFGGNMMNATDAAFAPKLYHALVALGHFRGWTLPDDLPAVQRYFDAIRALPEWMAVEYTPDTIVAGWARHGAHKMT